MLSDVMVRVRMGAGSESASDTPSVNVYTGTIPMVIVLLRSKSEQVPQIKEPLVYRQMVIQVPGDGVWKDLGMNKEGGLGQNAT